MKHEIISVSHTASEKNYGNVFLLRLGKSAAYNACAMHDDKMTLTREALNRGACLLIEFTVFTVLYYKERFLKVTLAIEYSFNFFLLQFRGKIH